MANIITSVKDHPIATILVIGVVVLVVYKAWPSVTGMLKKELA